jgi:hypothetical protein
MDKQELTRGFFSFFGAGNNIHKCSLCLRKKKRERKKSTYPVCSKSFPRADLKKSSTTRSEEFSW